ncbi:26S proteasome non-ATPase regulatory subunit 4 homolog [Rhizophagus clarus]|uniref:26S proteasome non-ATPase regulatory subunit 4 homolog n=1 Tax=Rhizophagus clarus TaxID=94130 RepID=A0A8H3LEL4_9GLOM|nr:26S proteasome non-ATPase regulatory subunit 4 homolog [Rhizophagus clarus]
MVLEATMLVLDNSEWMRNENTVGLLTMAGKGPEVLVTLTSDIGKILTALHNIKIGGKANLTTGIQVAQLALKHRQNKNQRQRIIVFVGSPIEADEKTLVKLAKKMKKNNVAVDIINFGEEAENTAKLEAFINAVNSGDNSHLVPIPPGPHILSDILISSPIIAGEDGVPAGFTASGGSNFEFGVDPNLDPELALALRISLEEEKARQEAEAAKAAGAAGSTQETQPTSMDIDKTVGDNQNDKTEDDMLAQALAMSSAGEAREGDVQMEETEDEQMARALQMSMEGGSEMNDQQFMGILQSLPGVDLSDPQIRNALQGFPTNNENNNEKDSKKKDEKKK